MIEMFGKQKEACPSVYAAKLVADPDKILDNVHGKFLMVTDSSTEMIYRNFVKALEILDQRGWDLIALTSSQTTLMTGVSSGITVIGVFKRR